MATSSPDISCPWLIRNVREWFSRIAIDLLIAWGNIAMDETEVDALVEAVNEFKTRKAARVAAGRILAEKQNALTDAEIAVSIAESDYNVADVAEDQAADALIALVQAEAA